MRNYTYIIDREEFDYSEEIKNHLELKEVLTEDEAKRFIELQNQFADEITDDINLLTVSSLLTKSPYRSKGMIFCLAKENDEIVGYGYANIDDDDKHTFYLNTIGVDAKHRGKKIGKEIKVKLIEHGLEFSEIKQIKAITQTDNNATIHINEQLGFILKNPDPS